MLTMGDARRRSKTSSQVKNLLLRSVTMEDLEFEAPSPGPEVERDDDH